MAGITILFRLLRDRQLHCYTCKQQNMEKQSVSYNIVSNIIANSQDPNKLRKQKFIKFKKISNYNLISTSLTHRLPLHLEMQSR